MSAENRRGSKWDAPLVTLEVAMGQLFRVALELQQPERREQIAEILANHSIGLRLRADIRPRHTRARVQLYLYTADSPERELPLWPAPKDAASDQITGLEADKTRSR